MFETELTTRALTYNFLLVLNARQLLYPVTLMADYSNTVSAMSCPFLCVCVFVPILAAISLGMGGRGDGI